MWLSDSISGWDQSVHLHSALVTRMGPTSRRLAFAVLMALVAAACSDDATGEAADDTDTAGQTDTAEQTDLPTGTECDGSVESPETRYVVDDCGRVVILRGANVESSSKGGTQDDPHLPQSGLELQERLGDWGWNTVRFLLEWGAVEPEAGAYDDAYLDEVEIWLDWYADNGHHVVLDFHQDLYGWKVGGNGAPDWAVIADGLEFTGGTTGGPWYLAATDPATQAAYQNFWDPERGHPELREHYWTAWQHVVGRFADHPAVIGYDLMNEPVFANGDLAATLAIAGQAAIGEFENPNLTEFMTDGVAAIREVDEDGWIFVQPTSLLNAFPYPGDLDAERIDDPRDGPSRLVYAGHLYEFSTHDGLGYSPDSTYVDDWERMRSEEAASLDAALWFGEWGGSADQERFDEYVDDVLGMADRQHAGWAYWSWDPGGWGPLTPEHEVSPNGELLFRVQPAAIAGTPVDFAWDPDTLSFTMTWTERAEAIGPTIISVPASLYPDGVDVTLSDADGSWSHDWDTGRGQLSIEADRSTDEHTVTIGPA